MVDVGAAVAGVAAGDDDEHATAVEPANTQPISSFDLPRAAFIDGSVRAELLGSPAWRCDDAGVDVYVQQLADAATEAVPVWLRRCVIATAQRLTGGCSSALMSAADEMVKAATPVVVGELLHVLATDVDAQDRNPLSIFRAAVRFPTAVLQQHEVPAVRRDDFAVRHFPADVYDLSPATWADVDESLREPGLIWGAWKAKTVLDRRRAEGRLPG